MHQNLLESSPKEFPVSFANLLEDLFHRGPRCVKKPRIRSFSVPYFSAFGLNTESYGVFLRIQLECGKIRTRKSSNTDTFHAVPTKGFFYI